MTGSVKAQYVGGEADSVFWGRVDCRAGDLPVPQERNFLWLLKLIMETNYLHTYYQNYQAPAEPLFPEVNRAVAKTSSKLAKILFICGVVVLLVLYLPSVIFALNPSKLNISELILSSFGKKTTASTVATAQKSTYQPRYDSKLPLTSSLTIRSAGINTTINESSMASYEDSLEKGVWRVPDYGTPYSRQLPTILAAHRYGYLRWSIPYRLKNSFYNLPKVKAGDTIEIVWRQRKYLYEVYATGKGEKIADYSADLILYTCESLNSPIRIFKYARLLEV